MKLHLSLLHKFIDSPLSDEFSTDLSPSGIENGRTLLNDLGVEVKNVEPHGAEGAIYTLELLANRGDHHGVLGIAREIAARTMASIKMPSLARLDCSRGISLPLRVNTKKCVRYIALEIELSDNLRSPKEVERFLLTAPTVPLVDTLNLVQYELGQPMHAFDRDRLQGELKVEELAEASEIVGLDGNTYKVPEGSIVITDAQKIVAVAGIIGCANSCVTETTRRAILESATFDPTSVRITAKAMGISTDASKVFERGSDPEMPLVALRRVVYLLGSAGSAIGQGGANVVGLSESQYRAEKREILVPLQNIINSVNSPRLPEFEYMRRLAILGFSPEIDKKNKAVRVTVPSWRLSDVHNDMDIIEEFVRTYGLSKIKRKAIVAEVEPVAVRARDITRETKILNRLYPILQASGHSEVITKSFQPEAWVEQFTARGFESKSYVRLLNSLEKGNSALRRTMLPHLLEVVSKNQAKGLDAVRCYELGRVFRLLPDAEVDEKTPTVKNEERKVLAFIAGGSQMRLRQSFKEDREQSVLTYKAVLEKLLLEVGIHPEWHSSNNGILHPGIQVQARSGRAVLGFLGVVHPEIVDFFEAKGDVFYGELHIDTLLDKEARQMYEEPRKYPRTSRDITLLLDAKNDAEEVLRKLCAKNIENLERGEVIDWFRRDGEEGNRVTFRIHFGNATRTLSGEEVDEEMGKIRGQIAADLISKGWVKEIG